MYTQINGFWPKAFETQLLVKMLITISRIVWFLPFINIILLRCVSYCKVPLGSTFHTKICKFLGIELSSTMSAKNFQWTTNLFLNKYIKMLNALENFWKKKYILVFSLKSSIKVMKYLSPSLKFRVIAPQRSECTNPRNAFDF